VVHQREKPQQLPGLYGANERSRTADLIITSELLYQLSYVGAASYDGARGW
jgi:hypothetical protein